MRLSIILLLFIQYYAVTHGNLFDTIEHLEEMFEPPHLVHHQPKPVFSGLFGNMFQPHVPMKQESFPFPNDCKKDEKLCSAVVRSCKNWDCSTQCLTDHAPVLSAECLLSHPCAQDIDNHCSSAVEGKNEIMQCLHSFRDKLSVSCVKLHQCLKTTTGCSPILYPSHVAISQPPIAISQPKIRFISEPRVILREHLAPGVRRNSISFGAPNIQQGRAFQLGQAIKEPKLTATEIEKEKLEKQKDESKISALEVELKSAQEFQKSQEKKLENEITQLRNELSKQNQKMAARNNKTLNANALQKNSLSQMHMETTNNKPLRNELKEQNQKMTAQNKKTPNVISLQKNSLLQMRMETKNNKLKKNKLKSNTSTQVSFGNLEIISIFITFAFGIWCT